VLHSQLKTTVRSVLFADRDGVGGQAFFAQRAHRNDREFTAKRLIVFIPQPRANLA
jgi:hypothetical protein